MKTRENYEERVRNFKHSIICEIVETLKKEKMESYMFNESFFIHFVEGEVASTEQMSSISIESGELSFTVIDINGDLEVMDDEITLLSYDTQTFIDTLCNLEDELRKNKLKELYQLVAETGGYIDMGGFQMSGKTHLNGLYIKDGKLRTKLLIDGVDSESEGLAEEISNIDAIIKSAKAAILDPEHLIALNDEQKDVLERFRTILAEMKSAGIGLIHSRDDDKVYAVNKKNIDEYWCDWSVEDGWTDKKGRRFYDITEFLPKETVGFPFDTFYYYGNNDRVFAAFK